MREPLKLRGADLRVELAGQDMASLVPLTGVPFPKTPPFRLEGKVDYAEGRVRLLDANGRVGRSDIGGDLTVSTDGERPDVTADLRSRSVDLADLGGLIGSEPGRTSTPGQTPQQRGAVARAEASPKLLPTTPVNMPRLTAANVHLRYRAERIQGQNMPFDSMGADVDIVDGDRVPASGVPRHRAGAADGERHAGAAGRRRPARQARHRAAPRRPLAPARRRRRGRRGHARRRCPHRRQRQVAVRDPRARQRRGHAGDGWRERQLLPRGPLGLALRQRPPVRARHPGAGEHRVHDRGFRPATRHLAQPHHAARHGRACGDRQRRRSNSGASSSTCGSAPTPSGRRSPRCRRRSASEAP